MFADSLIGKQLDEYRIDGPLGSGGMAHVYRALDTRLQRFVALKVITPGMRNNADYTARFEREAQAIAQLEHPNIVNIYRFGQADGLFYMVMQYITGTDLAHLIADYRANGEMIPFSEILRVVGDIGSALDYAHEEGVIHRDVKPGNIMFDRMGRAILTDFGLSLTRDFGTQGGVFGSPQYIAPEQVMSSRNVLPQSDLYALGVVTFEMLTGEIPFPADDPLEAASRHLADDPPLPSSLNGELPPAVDAVIAKILAKEPANRYESGKAFSEALNTALTVTDADTKRRSRVSIPEKIKDLMVPLPPLPPPMSGFQGTDRPTLVNPPFDIPDAGPTVSKQKSPLLLMYAVIIAIISLIIFSGIVLRLLLTRNESPIAIAATSTATNTIATATTIATDTSIPANTLPPTPTALVLAPTTQIPPTNPPPAATVALPADRNSVPSNAVRLGDFQVEAYCNKRGFGVALTNNQNDWACLNKSGSVAFILAASDFDSICQITYSNPSAFALRDQHKPVGGYNWSCFILAATPTPLVSAFSTPSYPTLRMRYSANFIALVNVSTMPLSLGAISFQNSNRVLHATDWNLSSLNPGECIRLFAGDSPPTTLPEGCAKVYDYGGNRTERDPWFTGLTVITINPSIQFNYRSGQ